MLYPLTHIANQNWETVFIKSYLTMCALPRAFPSTPHQNIECYYFWKKLSPEDMIGMSIGLSSSNCTFLIKLITRNVVFLVTIIKKTLLPLIWFLILILYPVTWLKSVIIHSSFKIFFLLGFPVEQLYHLHIMTNFPYPFQLFIPLSSFSHCYLTDTTTLILYYN